MVSTIQGQILSINIAIFYYSEISALLSIRRAERLTRSPSPQHDTPVAVIKINMILGTGDPWVAPTNRSCFLS